MREQIEWLNYWIEDADDEKKKRILLIGDSVARDYRKQLNRMFKIEGYSVDLLAMSFGIFDKLFLDEIEHFIKNVHYKYQYILFNSGSHHGYSTTCAENEELQKKYYNRLKDILDLLKSESENIVLMSGTPENECIPDSMNNEIEIRNLILKNVSINERYTFIDLYQILKEKEFVMADRFHYLDDGCEYIASFVKKSLGFGNEIIFSNKINNMKSFLRILSDAEHIYIYGDGKRAELINEYLHSIGRGVNQFIVSEEFYQVNNDNQVLLKEILNKVTVSDLILVTPESNEVWEKLLGWNLNYWTLSNKIYIFLEEYFSVFHIEYNVDLLGGE